MDSAADDSFGLVTSDNRAKPSFVAYNELIRQLANTEHGVPVKWNPGVRSYAFKRDGGKTVYVCWPKEGTGGALLWLRSKSPVKKTGIYGVEEILKPVQDVCALPVSGDPFYLEAENGDEISVAQGNGLISVDADLEVWGDGPYKLPMVLDNPSNEKMEGTLELSDAAGKAFWNEKISLDGGRKISYEPTLPDINGGEYELSFRQSTGEKGQFKIPILVSKVYEVQKAPGNPMEEDLASFVDQLSPIVIDTMQDVFELTFDPTIPRWMGKEDLSAQMRVCHDNSGIYFRIDVTDDRFVQKNPPGQMWKSDDVQLAISLPGQKNYPVFDIGLIGGQSILWCSRNADAAKQGQWDVPVRVTRVGNNQMVYEVYFPFEKLGIREIKPDSGIRFSLLVNEDDGMGRVRWIHWGDGIGKGNDPDLLGKAVLKL